MVETTLSRKERWAKAYKLQDFYNSTYNTNYGVKEFWKNDNPLSRRLVRYDVTFDMSMKGRNSDIGEYEFFIPQSTYSIQTLSDVENEEHITEATKSATADLFRGKSKGQVYDKTNVKVVRGVETGKVNYNDIDVNNIETNIQSSRVQHKIQVISKRGSSKNSKDYNLDIWVRNG
jgi:hypothetical protein